MLQRKTQTAEYWEREFEITEEDIEHLYSLILERNSPVSTKELVLEVIRHRCQQEEERMRAELSRGVIYQPRDSYEVGQQLVFPVFDYRVGTVVSIRPGHNPEHGEFDVIAVQFEDEDKPREFAANLKTPHKLNRGDDDGAELWEAAHLIPPDELYEKYGDRVRQLVVEALSRPDSEFVSYDDLWMLQGLLAEVHVGHLNLAEALIEVKGQPVTVQEILAELDLPEEIPEGIKEFSLNVALQQDERFDLVHGRDGELWFLRRMEPPEALSTPKWLVYTPVRYNRAFLSVELLQIEWELDDEWTEGGISTDSASLVPSTTVVLTYPHWKAGTLPLSSRTRSFFPPGDHKRGVITFVDGRWGQRFPGWIVYEDRYICGLRDWYEQHKLPPGAYIILERTADPNEIMVDFRPRRMRREWTRVASVEDGRLVFRMEKQPVACEYDEHVLIGEGDEAALEALRVQLAEQNVDIAELLAMVFPELAKLSPQGTVHAKTLYSAINIVRRCPPGPIFAALMSDRSYREMGNGYYALNVEA
ncbi:MAG TPA: hypothetical protein G4O02_18505 [Caldilineae bacterium]|nr:hypothetical protein [Caldilineae bacterium]